MDKILIKFYVSIFIVYNVLFVELQERYRDHNFCYENKARAMLLSLV